MAISSNVRQQTQWGVEASEGAGATITKRFGSFGLDATDNKSVSSNKPTGTTAATQGGIAFEDSSFSLTEGRLSYDEVTYLLDSVIEKVTATTPANATLARQRAYSVDQYASQPYQTYAVEVGDPGGTARGVRATGVSASEWGYEVSSTDENVTMTGSLLGGALETDTIATTGVTGGNYALVLPRHAKLYYASSFDELDSAPTEITSAFTAGFSITDRRALYRFLGKTDAGPSGTVESIPGLNFDLTIADEVNPVDAWLADFRTGVKVYFRIEFTGAEIEMSTDATPVPIYNTFTQDICTLLREGPGRADNQNILARTFPLQAAYDSDEDAITRITTVSALTAL